MKKFQPPIIGNLAEVIAYLQQFVPRVGRELERIEKKIPGKGASMEEILAAVRDSAEVKDAIYRYIKEREASET